MNNLEIYTNSVNQIFSCLDKLDQGLENQDNSNNINNIREYKEAAISFAKLISSLDSGNSTQDNGKEKTV